MQYIDFHHFKYRPKSNVPKCFKQKVRKIWSERTETMALLSILGSHPADSMQRVQSECLQVQWLLVRQVVVLSSNCLEMSNISNKWSSQTRRQENPKVIATDGYPPLLSVVQSDSKNAQLNMQFQPIIIIMTFSSSNF